MKLENLKLGQEVTVYKYYFNSENDIKVSELHYYVHIIDINNCETFDTRENTTKTFTQTIITLDAVKPYDYDPHTLEMKVEDGDKFETHGNELSTFFYSLNNNEETLNKFKSQTIDVLKRQVEYYSDYEKNIHREYVSRLERLNKLILNYGDKEKVN